MHNSAKNLTMLKNSERKDPNIVKAPFTPEQVENLNEYQKLGKWHPFTCCSPEDISECQRRSGENEGLLVASEEGWTCPCGKYKQDWCHQFMTDVKTLKENWNNSPFGRHRPIE